MSNDTKLPTTSTHVSINAAMDSVGADLIRADRAGSLYPLRSRRWHFHDGTHAVCIPWGDNMWKLEIIS